MYRNLMFVFMAAVVNANAAELQITDTAVRQPLPGRTVSVGYLSIKNTETQPIRLLKATSANFANIELHQHKMVDGMMQMQRLTEIEIAAGETVKLQPGGLHLMMFRPVAILQLDDEVAVDLHWSDGSVQTYKTKVVAVPKQ
jgi:copper(I)-binding protein